MIYFFCRQGPELGEFYAQCMNKEVGVACRPVYIYQLVWIWCEEGSNMGFHVIKLPISAKCTSMNFNIITGVF